VVYLIVEPFASKVCYSLMTDSIMILAVPPPPQPPIGGCCCYLAKVRVGLKGISRVMPLLAFLLLEVLVELKGLARVMLLRVLCFGAYSTLCGQFLGFCPRNRGLGCFGSL
jgi:hypothetical protein